MQAERKVASTSTQKCRYTIRPRFSMPCDSCRPCLVNSVLHSSCQTRFSANLPVLLGAPGRGLYRKAEEKDLRNTNELRPWRGNR